MWLGVVAETTYRLVDLGAGATPRLILEQQQPPDSMGGVGWARISLPLADVLETAFLAILNQR
jgi:hypothetical protein